MQFGFFTDSALDSQDLTRDPWNKTQWHPDLNTQGYRCPEWHARDPHRKSVVVLGCSHTFGQGLPPGDHWVDLIATHRPDHLQYWNLGVPGASGQCCVRRLWGTQHLIMPSWVIMCWPDISRRAWYGHHRPLPSHGTDLKNQHHTDQSDLQEFMQNVFWVQKYSEITGAPIIHSFATHAVAHPDLAACRVLTDHTLMNCWPLDDTNTPSLALDGKHYGTPHHARFAELLLDSFGSQLM